MTALESFLAAEVAAAPHSKQHSLVYLKGKKSGDLCTLEFVIAYKVNSCSY